MNLYYNQLDDASLATLRSMPELRGLYISGEKITDAGLVHIKELKKLEYLSISWTKATQAGIDDLKKSLPGLRVDYQGITSATTRNESFMRVQAW